MIKIPRMILITEIIHFLVFYVTRPQDWNDRTNPNDIGNEGQNIQLENNQNQGQNLHQNQNGQVSCYQNPDTSDPHSVDNTSAWLKNKDVESKRQKIMACNGSLLNVASIPNLRAMPLPWDNGLPVWYISWW